MGNRLRAVALGLWLMGCASTPTPTPAPSAPSAGGTANARVSLSTEPTLTAPSAHPSEHASVPAPEGVQGTSASARANPARLTLRAAVDVDAPSGRRRVRNGATLHSGDQIAATVMVDREAYVYLLSLDPEGQASVLFPDGPDAGRVAAGARVRVPPEGSVIRLDERTGTETLLVVASERPLATSDPELAAVIHRARAEAAPPAAPASVEHAHPRRRSRHRVQASRAGSDDFAPFPHRGVVTESLDGDGAYARAQADDGGVASFRYVFPHIP